MSKKIYVDAFYGQYEDLLQQMSAVFPEDPDWARYRTGLAVLRRANPTMLVQKTWEYVSPYEQAIQTRNETFFLTHDVSGGYMVDTVTKLRNMWGQLTPHNRGIVWEYITNITYLAKKCAD
jgi:hypothetical protein